MNKSAERFSITTNFSSIQFYAHLYLRRTSTQSFFPILYACMWSPVAFFTPQLEAILDTHDKCAVGTPVALIPGRFVTNCLRIVMYTTTGKKVK